MGAVRRWVGYVRTRISGSVEARMDPEVQLEQAVEEARKRDEDLRRQAARVIAHRTEVQLKLDRAADDAGHKKSLAIQAIRNAEAAQARGDGAEVERMTVAAERFAMDLEASESVVEMLKAQYRSAAEAAELAKRHVDDNAFELQRLAARRLELLGKLEQAKLQEQINKTLQTLQRPVDTSAPTFAQVEEKIDKRMALAAAEAELDAGSSESSQRDLERAIAEVSAQTRLASLREEIGLPAGAPQSQIGAAPAPGPAQSEEAASPAAEGDQR